MVEVIFYGKRFSNQEEFIKFKKEILPRMIDEINLEYYKQNIAKECELTLLEWQHLNLCHWRTANINGWKWRAGMPAWDKKEASWGTPNFEDFHS